MDSTLRIDGLQRRFLKSSMQIDELGYDEKRIGLGRRSLSRRAKKSKN